MNIASFLKVFAGDIRVGAVMPSSSFAVRNIFKRIPERLHAVLEYGPGDGVITKRLLERLDADGKLLAIETNKMFLEALGKIADPRLKLVDGDATKAAHVAAANAMSEFDLVISGIPFSMLSDSSRRDLVEKTHALLKPGGTFLVYQTSPLMVRYLKKKFSVKTFWEPRNVPPYFIMQGTSVATDVPSQEKRMTLKPGDKAPAIILPDQDGKTVSLADLGGKWVLLYFYPKDDTPGCTTQACGIRDNWSAFKKAGLTVLGVSADPVKKHKKFVDKYELPFTLLADEEKNVLKAYGVWAKKKFMGREYMGILRNSFLIAPDGRIAKVYEGVKPPEHAEAVLADVKALKA